MPENKIARIPVASHGLHRHTYNYPWLSSINFGDVMPCYYNPLRKGERDNPRAGLYSQLMPIAHNAFATGRYNFKAIFVPYKLVWRPWYAFAEQVQYQSNGSSSRPERYPYVQIGEFSRQFCQAFGVEDGSEDDYDVVLFNHENAIWPTDAKFVHLKPSGRRVLRILGALGCTPSFIPDDKRTMNILSLLCYIKAFTDYYFPNQFVGSSAYTQLAFFADTDKIDFTDSIGGLLSALEMCSLNYYENSIFDLAWIHPATPSTGGASPSITINDVTDPDRQLGNANVTNTSIDAGTPSLDSQGASGFTQYLVNALKSVSMWAKRRQFSGARLLDKFLVSRGVEISNDSARISYFLGQRNVEIEVSGVENNTDTNLGELAGRGIASSGNQPLSFDCNADDDGIFFVICSPVPDANFPVYFDGFSNRKDFMDTYTAEYDKLGSSAVPKHILQSSFNGQFNGLSDRDLDGVFGFLNMYWDEVQEKPRLLGDFCLKARGSRELQAYHTFRLFTEYAGVSQGLGFVRMIDNSQYQRLFYNDEQENLMLFLRWSGSQYKEKLPLGDSYDWDDDELNRKVSVVVGGSQK